MSRGSAQVQATRIGRTTPGTIRKRILIDELVNDGSGTGKITRCNPVFSRHNSLNDVLRYLRELATTAILRIKRFNLCTRVALNRFYNRAICGLSLRCDHHQTSAKPQ